MINGKKLKRLKIGINENNIHIENISEKFDFPLLEELALGIFLFRKKSTFLNSYSVKLIRKNNPYSNI